MLGLLAARKGLLCGGAESARTWTAIVDALYSEDEASVRLPLLVLLADAIERTHGRRCSPGMDSEH
jgi:hypothetical protein